MAGIVAGDESDCRLGSRPGEGSGVSSFWMGDKGSMIMPIADETNRANALRPPLVEPYARRYTAIRAELDLVRAAPYAYGRNGPHRRQRDEDILLCIAADLYSRMIAARAAA